MRKKIVAGNWKMNTELMEAVTLVRSVQDCAMNVDGVEKVIIPPLPFIKTISELTNEEKNFFTGAQNCSEHLKGAYTGETSAAMLKSVGCKYVLVGHSERRAYFNESTVQLISKIKNILDAGLNPVFCFGEQLAERKSGQHFEVVRSQLLDVLKKYPKDRLDNLVLAYEPVWAIGTGETASPLQAQEMHAYIRSVIEEVFGKAAGDNISILYGGSCNAQNARELFACKDVDGGLIGGASLKAEDFCTIIASFS